MFSSTFKQTMAKNSLAKNSVQKNSEKLTSRQSRLNQLSQRSSCKEFNTCLQQERYEYMKNKFIYQPRKIEYVLAPNQKPIKYRYGGFHKTMRSFHKESYRNAIKKHKIAQNPPKFQAISRSNNNTLQATLDPYNQKQTETKSKPQKQDTSYCPKAQMLKELEIWKASDQKKSAASPIVFEGIQGKSMNLNLNVIQNFAGQHQDFKTLLSTKSQQMYESLQNNGVNNLQLQSFSNRIVSENETDQVTPLIHTTGGHTGGDKSVESSNSKLFPKLISPVEIIQEGLVTDDVSMKNFTDELHQKPIQVLLTNNNSTANQKVNSAQSGHPNLTDQDKQLIINLGEDLESMNSKFSNSKSGSISKNSPIQKKYKNAIRFENIRQSSILKPETDSKISHQSPDNIVIIKSNKMDGPSTRLSKMINNPITQSNEDPQTLLKQGNDELVQSVLDDTFRSNSCQKMIARDMEDEDEPENAQEIDLLAGEATKEIQQEIRDNQVASLNEYNLNNRVGTSVTDLSRSIRSRKVSVNSRGELQKSKQSFQQQTISRGEMSKLLKDPHLKVNIDLNQNNGMVRSLRKNKSAKRVWNFLQPNIQNLNFEDISQPLPKNEKRPQTSNHMTAKQPQFHQSTLIHGPMVATNYKCFSSKSPVQNSSQNIKKAFVPTDAHGKSFMHVENIEEVPKNYMQDMMVYSNSIYHAQIYQREKAELLLKQQKFQKQAEDALKQLCKATGTDMNTFHRNTDRPIEGGTLEGSLSPASNGRASSKVKSDMAMLMDQVGWDAQVLTLLEQNQDQNVISYIEQNKDQFGTLQILATDRNSDTTQRESQRIHQHYGIPSPFSRDDSNENQPMIYISNDSQQQRKNAFLKSSLISPNADQTYTSDSQINPLIQSPQSNFFGKQDKKQNLQDTQYAHNDDRHSTDECNETKVGLDLYQQATSGDNINLAPKLLQNLDSRLNLTKQRKAQGTKTSQDRYQSAGQLPGKLSKDMKSQQSGLTRPFSKRSNAQFSNTNLSEIEKQAQYRRNVPCLAIRPQQIKIPKSIGQSVQNLDKLQKRRALISHRDVIKSIQFNPGKYLPTQQKSETYRSSMNNRNTNIHQNSNVSISQTRKQTEDLKSQITMVENNFMSNDGSMVNIIATQRTTKPPKSARPFTAKEDRQKFQKQRMMTARQKVIDSRYKQRQALFMNKHNTQHNAQVILAKTNSSLNNQPQTTRNQQVTTNMQNQVSLKQLKESISQNFLRHVPQSPLKYFNQENNSQIDDVVRRSNAQYGQRAMGQKANFLFSKIDDEHKSDLNIFQYGQFTRRSSARVNNKDMDVIIPNDGMASAIRKLGTLKADSNGSQSMADQSKVYIQAKSQRNFGPQQLQSSQYMDSPSRKVELTEKDKNMPEQSIFQKTGNRQYEQDFRDLNKSLNQKTIITGSNSKHAIQPILDYNNQQNKQTVNSLEDIEQSLTQEPNVHLSSNLQKSHQKNLQSHTQMSGEGHVVVEKGGDQVKIMSAGRKRVAMSKLGNRSSQHVSNAAIGVSSSFQNPVDGQNKFHQLKQQPQQFNESTVFNTEDKARKKKSITNINMAQIDNQMNEEHIYGQNTLRDTGGKVSGHATLIHEIESPVVFNDPEDSPLKLHNPTF